MLQANAVRVNSTNIISGIDDGGMMAVRGGRKGQVYHVRPAEAPAPEEIRKLRKDAGLKREEFADVFGVSVSAVSSWETGRRMPDGIACRFFDILMENDGILKEMVRG